MNPTKKYIAQHKSVFALKKNKVFSGAPSRRVVGWSIMRLLKNHLKLICICALHLPFAIYEGRHFWKKTWRLKANEKKKKALLIGNGPSQGYLKASDLDNFVKSGGETYCVNYWNQNKRLAKHIPTWLCYSDTAHLLKKSIATKNFIQYLKNNPSIKILIPSHQIKPFKELQLSNEVFCFMDLELGIWKNTNPLFPRGYLSMSLYKMLAWAVYLDYNSIGIIGMDNTYPRDIYNDKNNKICNIETHAGIKDSLRDLSQLFCNIAAWMDDVTLLFYHLEYFPQKNIVNLDPYSLTDRFKKVNKDKFLRNKL